MTRLTYFQKWRAEWCAEEDRRRKILDEQAEAERRWQEQLTKALEMYKQSLLEEEEVANRRRRARKERRRNRRPIAGIGPAFYGPYSALLSNAGTPFKPNSKKFKKKKEKKNSLSPPPATESLVPKQIFILAGEGNMAGRGGVFMGRHRRILLWDGVVSPECGSHRSIHRQDAQLRWVPAREPLHGDVVSEHVVGVGPGMAFANAVRKRVGAVGLVPCAIAGMEMGEWARGAHVYESMVRRAKESVKGGGVIKGLLWYQGESDTSTQHDADSYHGNMVTFIENVREDFGLPSLPIIQVAIGSGDERYMEKVRETQLGLKVPNVVCVDAKGLELQDDDLYLTTKGQVQLGYMLADAYLNHFGASKAQSHPVP